MNPCVHFRNLIEVMINYITKQHVFFAPIARRNIPYIH